MLEQSLRSLQVQTLTPQVVHSLQLLSMPLLALGSYLSRAVLDNPYLELRYDDLEVPCGLPGDPAPDLALWEDRVPEAAPSLWEHLRAQARLCPFSPREFALAELLIANLNGAGYLELDPVAAGAAVGCGPETALGVLSALQASAPKGVGARSLGECLLLQADPARPDYRVLRDLLIHDLPALAAHRFTELTRKYKLSRPRLQALADYIQTLDPKPGACWSAAAPTPYLLPEAVVELSGPSPEIRVRGGAASLLRYDPDYMAGVEDPEAAAFLARKRSEALSLMDSLDLRHRALEQLTAYVVWAQAPFFREGPAALRPLTQKEAAEALGLSPSTVSRCVRDKYLSTPRGTYPLSYFFSGRQNGAETPAAAAQAALKALIAREDPAHPLDDAGLAGRLADQNIHISRRTVAKYRAQLGIGGRTARTRRP